MRLSRIGLRRGRSAAIALGAAVGLGAVALLPPALAAEGSPAKGNPPATPGRPAAGSASAAPLLEGMGAYTRPGASNSPLAQRYFDQGVVLTWGFNPEEAARAFEAAARIDPKCGACWWGLAWALGPNINSDMDAAAAARVQAALARARSTSVRAPDPQRALIAALSARHPSSKRPAEVDEAAYARRMRELARAHPGDADVATLAAEAAMNLHPYDWWEGSGAAKPWTPEITALLERALALDPDHPGANHYWIHLMESSAHPERALPSAKRLERLVPGSGHLMHMPAHVYLRVGRYHDASVAGERSIAADLRYLAQVDAQGAYRVGYAAHNHHYLWASASMEGRSALALDAARAAYRVACGPKPGDLSTATLQHYAALQLYTLVRFGRWEQILHDTLPPESAEPYPMAAWHFARGTALARTGRTDEALRELGKLEALASDPALGATRIKNINAASAIVRIALLSLQAELARSQGRTGTAADLLGETVRLEDALEPDEPHLWLAPTRQALGNALLAAGRAAEAERVFRQDLAHYPANAWSLGGLADALASQGREAEAAAARAQARAAWRHADVPLETILR